MTGRKSIAESSQSHEKEEGDSVDGYLMKTGPIYNTGKFHQMTGRDWRSTVGYVRIKTLDTAEDQLKEEVTRVGKFIPQNNMQMFNSGNVVSDAGGSQGTTKKLDIQT